MRGQKLQTTVLQELLTDMLYTLSEHHFVEDLSSSLANKPIYRVNIEYESGGDLKRTTHPSLLTAHILSLAAEDSLALALVL